MVRLVGIIGISMRKHVQCEHVVIRSTHNIRVMSYQHDKASSCVYHAIAINKFGSCDQYTITLLVLRIELPNLRFDPWVFSALHSSTEFD